MYLLCLCINAKAQIGGRQSFEFLRIPSSARIAGVGGVNVSLHQADINTFWHNPATLTKDVSKHLGFSYAPWQADIHTFQLLYAQAFKKIGMWGLGLQTVNYGQMELTDPSGTVQGTFKASDFALQLSHSFQQDYFQFGASLKFLGSQIESYNAYGMAIDLGATFVHPKHDLTFGMVIKNLGFGLNNYTTDSKVKMPLDVQIGTSFKPTYMPFRFSITLHHLYQWDIVYLDPNQQTTLDINGNPIIKEKTFFDKLARHFVIGGEMLIAKGFQVRLGYNHLINREMRIQDVSGLRGFSFGFMIRTKKFEFGYSRGTYQIGAGRNFLSLSSNLGGLLKRKKTEE